MWESKYNLDYQYLNSNDEPWFCLKCNSKIFPFQTLNNKTFNLHVSDSNIQKDYGKDYSCKLVLKLCPNLNSLLNQFNDSSQTHDFKVPENVVA